MSKYFYCYSNRLHKFLEAFGVEYITSAINPSSNKNYWMYEKSENLDMLIEEWNRIKEKFSLKDVMSKNT